MGMVKRGVGKVIDSGETLEESLEGEHEDEESGGGPRSEGRDPTTESGDTEREPSEEQSD